MRSGRPSDEALGTERARSGAEIGDRRRRRIASAARSRRRLEPQRHRPFAVAGQASPRAGPRSTARGARARTRRAEASGATRQRRAQSASSARCDERVRRGDRAPRRARRRRGPSSTVAQPSATEPAAERRAAGSSIERGQRGAQPIDRGSARSRRAAGPGRARRPGRTRGRSYSRIAPAVVGEHPEVGPARSPPRSRRRLAAAVTSRPKPASARPAGRPDRREVAQPVERRAAGDGRRPAVEADEVVGEPRDGASEARVSARDAGLALGDRRRRRRPAPRRSPSPRPRPTPVQVRPGARRSRPAGEPVDAATPRDRSTRAMTIPAPMSAKPVGEEPGDEVGRRVVGRRRPDVRLPAERREQDEHLGQAAVEGVRLGRPADRREPVPERLRVDRIVEQDRHRRDRAARDRARRGPAPRAAAAGASPRRIDIDRHGRTRYPRKTVRPGDASVGRAETDPATRRSPMHRRPLVTLAAGAVLVLAACSSGGGHDRAGDGRTARPHRASRRAPAARPAAGPPCAESAGGRRGQRSSIENFAFDPADITAKVGDASPSPTAIRRPHTATLDDGSCTTPNIGHGRDRTALVVHRGRDVPVPLQRPPEHEGHDHDQLDRRRDGPPRSAPRQARSATNSVAPDGRSISVGSGRPASANHARDRLAGRERRALVQLVELDAGDQLALARPELLQRRTAAASRGRAAGRRARAPPTPPRSAADRVGQLVEGVLEVGEVERGPVGRAAAVDRRAVADLDPVGEPGRRDVALAPGRPNPARTRRPTSSSAGNRRAIAISQRPPPQWMSTTRPPRDRLGDELRQRGQRLLEEDRDVLDASGARSTAGSGRVASRTGTPRPEEVEHPGPVERGDHARGRTGRRGTPGARRRAGSSAVSSSSTSRSPSELGQLVGVGGRDPGRRSAAVAAASRWPARRRSALPRRRPGAGSNSPSSTPR